MMYRNYTEKVYELFFVETIVWHTWLSRLDSPVFPEWLCFFQTENSHRNDGEQLPEGKQQRRGRLSRQVAHQELEEATTRYTASSSSLSLLVSSIWGHCQWVTGTSDDVISSCCPVCCVVLFQPHLCHICGASEGHDIWPVCVVLLLYWRCHQTVDVGIN